MAWINGWMRKDAWFLFKSEKTLIAIRLSLWYHENFQMPIWHREFISIYQYIIFQLYMLNDDTWVGKPICHFNAAPVTLKLRISWTENNLTVYISFLHPYPWSDGEGLFSDVNDSSPLGPGSITSITCMASKAEPKFLVRAAPIQPMIVTHKYCLQTWIIWLCWWQ